VTAQKPENWVPDGNRFVCAKYRALAGRKGSPIDPGSPACRYFAARPAFNAARPRDDGPTATGPAGQAD
jgi:hypothetical protein